MSDNPLLAGLKLPGRIFQLPSRGVFYKNDEFASNVTNGEIHVKAMSAYDEITLKNADQLFSGEAIKSVFPKCIEDINLPLDLLARDVDAIMIFLRIVTYGNEFEVSAKHNCADAKDHSYIIDLNDILNKIKPIDQTIVEKENSVVISTGQKVMLRPLKYSYVMDVVKKNHNKTELTVNDQKDNLRQLLLGVIDSVDGITDRHMIEEWVSNLSYPMINKIGAQVEKINNWGVDNIADCKCKDCGESFKLEIPLNPITFFTE